ncbi:MAG: glycosyltransferase family 39 protein [Anaerolineae bacterium]|nr:glycosyltransferase family 39 protein [Anaerolineae bacterium]
MPYWLTPALVTLPVFLASYLLAGTPWVWLILPRRHRRDRALLLTLGLALGGVLWTTGMFLLGTFLRITLAGTLLAGGLIAGWGWLLVYLQANRPPHPLTPSPTRREGEQQPGRAPRVPTTSDANQHTRHSIQNSKFTIQNIVTWEWLIVIGLSAAVLIRVFHTAYWPFTAYDPLWVYGYNGRLFLLSGQIPASMGYYPQLMPLSYTYGQLVWGGMDDHAARMAVVVFGLGSILAAYQLGAKLVNRRVGLLAAALWTFYPHHAQWARFGDLEVPLTFYFTLSALFFVLAWRVPLSRPLPHAEGEEQAPAARWRYAILSGLMLAGAMWTKPTAGALVLGIGVVFVINAVAVFLARYPHPGNLRLLPLPQKEGGGPASPFPRGGGRNPTAGWWDGGLWERFKIVVAVGLAAAPVGGMWYVRNVLLGHQAVIFPASFWLTQAQRSGQELGWPLLLLALLALYLLLDEDHRPDPRLLLPGVALLIVGALPSAGLWAGTATHRLRLEEIGVMALGGVLYALAIWRWWRARHALTGLPLRAAWSRADHPTVLIVALVVPYFVTWFWSYSYHPRLAFAITPLQLLLVAWLLAKIAPRLARFVRPTRRRTLALAALLTLILPGLWLTGEETLWHVIAADLPDDDAKHRASNYALFRTVEALREEVAAGPVVVSAPGALRLPFFFPAVPINTTITGDLSALDDACTHFITGFEAENAFREASLIPSAVRALPGRPRLATLVHADDDVHFNYDLYAIETALRWVQPRVNAPLETRPLFGEVARLQGAAISGLDFWPNRRLVLSIYWRARRATDADYTVLLHVTDGDNLVATWDHTPGGGEYPTYLWTPGEYVVDVLNISLGQDVPPGEYRVEVGLYDAVTLERLPITAGAEADTIADVAVLLDYIQMLPGPPE